MVGVRFGDSLEAWRGCMLGDSPRRREEFGENKWSFQDPREGERAGLRDVLLAGGWTGKPRGGPQGLRSPPTCGFPRG